MEMRDSFVEPSVRQCRITQNRRDGDHFVARAVGGQLLALDARELLSRQIGAPITRVGDGERQKRLAHARELGHAARRLQQLLG